MSGVYSKVEPMVVDEFDWDVGFVFLSIGVVSWSVSLVLMPLDTGSFDLFWKVVYGSSSNRD